MRCVILLFFLFQISGCTTRNNLPSDVSGELEPINHSQVISYE
ncbi:conjugal transfer protein [Salmonella enterica subsp. enterica serovar Infantis]|uniref:Conjugal transfer protein n=13 Tax=Enterobacteriaceae TaxID=543 RepID=G8GYF6_ECOLX|nr:Pilx7 [Escherichia coli]AMY28461.1 pilx7 [Klebsiella pneumoniae]AVS19195.1 conjugal transfer protein [Salmonella enterica]AWJ96664.1 Pilx7 [Salmonella enterica subsp. enterica serovar California]AWS98696.1 conjugal transfer protein [Citrobacter sp. CRE-46]AZZ00673.1 conjugal transfer protein [Salmonella sp. SSDFZ69]EAA2220501.1 conjugal transfer protein [Salmonella enterica subsp. enterica serovar Newport]EAA3032642.1 conjugal transfer protein [Salmonella enterica subsp. enterica serovar 